MVHITEYHKVRNVLYSRTIDRAKIIMPLIMTVPASVLDSSKTFITIPLAQDCVLRIFSISRFLSSVFRQIQSTLTWNWLSVSLIG